ncbi:hypothetical protein [Mesorhizobium sp. NFR06]|uniref:hypothetical protein n=1 Tax=Mesorhizobium sp. NFR06 TaxID=1566290 RepID=UPI00165F7164|nr:hypothetical protein [Mesorhizobium sp. NFR06]
MKPAPSPFRDERDRKKAFPGTFVENGDEKQTRSAAIARCGEFVMKTAAFLRQRITCLIEAACNGLMLADVVTPPQPVADRPQVAAAGPPFP